MRARCLRRPDDERGMITAFTATLTLGLVFVAGMVYDGGQRVNTYMRASDLASSAARAGAQQAVPSSLYDDQPGTVIDPSRAQAAVRAFLEEAESAAVADAAEVTFVGDDAVQVQVTLQQTAVILTWLGTVDIDASATATATPGVAASTGGP